MRLGEAMARCPALRLVPPDPEGVRSLWNTVLDRLEAIGAQVESDRAGVAYFESGGLRGLHGGDLAGVLSAARRALGPGARFGAAPCRFAAHAAALQVRPRRPAGVTHFVVEESELRDFLTPLPVSLLRTRFELEALPELLEQLGIRTLGELAELSARVVAERFGHPGLLALDLARGRDTALEPRRPPEPVVERLDLPEAASGQQLERALELLVARVLARRERRGRSLRGARGVGALRGRRHVAHRRHAAPRERRSPRGSSSRSAPSWPSCRRRRSRWRWRWRPSARPLRIRAACSTRRRRSGAAAWARPSARRARRRARRPLCRILEVDSDSRIPERRAVLAPFPDAASALTPAGSRRLGEPKPARVQADEERGAAGRGGPGRRRGARGVGRGGPLVDRPARCAGATSSSCWWTAATSSSSATWSPGAGFCSGPSGWRPCAGARFGRICTLGESFPARTSSETPSPRTGFERDLHLPNRAGKRRGFSAVTRPDFTVQEDSMKPRLLLVTLVAIFCTAAAAVGGQCRYRPPPQDRPPPARLVRGVAGRSGRQVQRRRGHAVRVRRP